MHSCDNGFNLPVSNPRYVVWYAARCLTIVCYRGHTFRTAFSKLGSLRALTQAPFMALTATASATTQSAISEALKLVEPVVVSLDLNRHNIFLSVSAIRTMCVSNGHWELTAA